jgi:hypothetical protein
LTTTIAALSFPLLILVCFWLDRYEPEPGRYRLAALGWGGVAAVVLSFIAEQLLFSVPGTDTFVDTAVIAPFIEEFAKGLFLVAIVIFRRAQVHGVLDGIVYGALVGIGFAFVEDIPITSALNGERCQRLSSCAASWGRSPTHCYLGGALGSALPSRPVGQPYGSLPPSSAPGAVRCTPRGTAARSGAAGVLLRHAAIMLPLLHVLAVAIWANIAGQDAHHRVAADCPDGLVSQEIRWIAQLSDRMSARAARRIGGKLPRGRFGRQHPCRDRVPAGPTMAWPAGPQPADGGLLQRAASLRPYVILPPPILPRPLPR